MIRLTEDEQKLFTLKEAMDIYEAGFSKADAAIGKVYFNTEDDEPTKEEYFLKQFNIQL